MEGYGRTIEAEEGYQRLVYAEPRDKGCLLFVTFNDSYAIKGYDDVEFSIYLGIADSIEGFADKREGVSILDRDIIDAVVVLVDTDSTAGLTSEEERRRRSGLG